MSCSWRVESDYEIVILLDLAPIQLSQPVDLIQVDLRINGAVLNLLLLKCFASIKITGYFH